jgi:signal transduction histidine kinase
MIDTGCGMDEEDLNNIFDLFYRGTNSRLEKGMGIGLSVVKNIITTHGWNIEVESKKDFGSKFRIVIPISEQSE